jgi:hypothetical protein
MLPFGVTIPASVPQRSEIPEGLMNYPVVYGFIFVSFGSSAKLLRGGLGGGAQTWHDYTISGRWQICYFVTVQTSLISN